MRSYLLFLFIILFSINIFSQQVIGEFFVMNGGFEGENTGAMTAIGNITSSQTQWTAQFTNEAIVLSTGGRSGPYFVQFINYYNEPGSSDDNSSTARFHSPTVTFSENTDYIVQFFRQGPFVNGDPAPGDGFIRTGVSWNDTISPNYGNSPQYQTTYFGTWNKFVKNVMVGSSSEINVGVGLVSTQNVNPVTSYYYIDDFVIYEGTTVDDDPPPAIPNTGTIEIVNTNDYRVTWEPPADVTDVVGYLVYRTIGPRNNDDPVNFPPPNQNGIYAVGNIIGTGTDGEGVVIDIIPETALSLYESIDEDAVDDNEDYHYYVWAVDKAFNYSSNATVLPVELESFTALVSGNSVQLNWSTSTEVNNYGFEIHRSLNKTSWDNIGFVQGNGNSNSVKNYAYSDNKLSQNGIYYYRLKQIDNDGAFEYSNIVEVNFNNEISDYFLSQNYPNPFNSSTQISFSLPGKNHVKLKVFNIMGEEVALFLDEIKEAGIHYVNIGFSDVPSGVYLYMLETNQGIVGSKKMILLR